MKRKLLFTAFAFLALQLSAADITPAGYVFPNQPLGPYEIKISPNTWNTPTSWTALTTDFVDKFVVIAGGTDISGTYTAENPLHKSLFQGVNIVDLGGDVGKCLVIRGKNSKYNVGTPMGADYTGTIFNLSFYSGKKDATKWPQTKIRIRMVYSIYENILNPASSVLSKAYLVTYSGNPLGHDLTQNIGFPSKFFALKDSEGRFVEDDNGDLVYDPTV